MFLNCTKSDLEDCAIDNLLGGLLADLDDHGVLDLLEVGYLVVERQVLDLQDRIDPVYHNVSVCQRKHIQEEKKHRGSIAYEVNAGLVEKPCAAGREVDAAEDLVVGHIQGEERRRRWDAKLGSCRHANPRINTSQFAIHVDVA